MKKQALETIDLKKEELQNAIMFALNQIEDRLEVSIKQLSDNASKEIRSVVDQLSDQVDKTILEIKSIPPTTVPGTTQPSQPAQADDMSWKDVAGKALEMLTPEKDWEDWDENAVSGVRGSVSHTKVAEPISSRDNDDNPELPDFWRQNVDLAESPYLYMDELGTITDEVTDEIVKKKKS